YGAPGSSGAGDYGAAPGAGYGGARADTSAGQSNGQPAGPGGVDVFLTASGVPNDGGRLKWPTALRTTGAPEDEELRRQTEALFQVAALQAQSGKVNPRLTQELTRVIRDLRVRLAADNERKVLTPAVFEEARRFLDRLERAPELLERALATPAG